MEKFTMKCASDLMMGRENTRDCIYSTIDANQGKEILKGYLIFHVWKKCVCCCDKTGAF